MGGVSITSSTTFPYTVLLDETGAGVTYVGRAAPSSPTSLAVWQIKKLETNGNVFSVSYANGNSNFDSVWDDRASLNYS